MDIAKSLAAEHSKKMTMAIVAYIGDDKKKFRTLIDIFFNGEYRLTQRAAWPLSYICTAHTSLMKPYMAKLIGMLGEEGLHPSLPRNILRIFQETGVPEKFQSAVLDICYRFLLNPSAPVACRAFSITVASHICNQHPDLARELLIVLNEIKLQPQTPAIRQRLKLAFKNLPSVNSNY